MFSLLLKYLLSNYSGKIIEVGCGRYSSTAFALSQCMEIIAIDILDADRIDYRIRPIYVRDDVTSPDLRLYLHARLLYSIRPPFEIQRSILNLAEQVKADVLIKPLGTEIVEDARLRLSNYRGLPLYRLESRSAFE